MSKVAASANADNTRMFAAKHKDLEILPTNEYLIRNRHSRMYLNVEGASLLQSARLNQEYRRPEVKVSNIWLIFPVNKKRVLVINKLSSLSMTVFLDKYMAGRPIVQEELKEETFHSKMFWQIQRDPDTGYHRIKNAISNHYLAVEGFSNSRHAFMTQWNMQDVAGPGRESQLWEFKVFREFHLIPPFIPFQEVSVVHNRCRYFSPPSRSGTIDPTHPVLVGQVVIPSFMIDDPNSIGLNHVLRRYSYWKCRHVAERVGAVEKTNVLTTEGGIQHTMKDEVLRVTGLQICPRGVFYLNGPIRLCSEAIAQGLRVEVARTPKAPEIPLVAEDVMRYREGDETKDCFWYAEDYYVLKSIVDNRTVLWWNVTNLELRVYQCYQKINDEWVLALTDE